VLRGVPGAPGAAVTALTGLRRRLGPRPLELLFQKVAGALSPGREPWSHACGLLLAAWDGTTLKLPASEENKAWARGTGRGGHYPRARLVALAACGTRGLIAAAAGLVQFAGLLPGSPDQGRRLRVGQPGAVLEQVEVHRQARQGGAQFV
jgi:hypothetical protein